MLACDHCLAMQITQPHPPSALNEKRVIFSAKGNDCILAVFRNPEPRVIIDISKDGDV